MDQSRTVGRPVQSRQSGGPSQERNGQKAQTAQPALLLRLFFCVITFLGIERINGGRLVLEMVHATLSGVFISIGSALASADVATVVMWIAAGVATSILAGRFA